MHWLARLLLQSFLLTMFASRAIAQPLGGEPVSFSTREGKSQTLVLQGRLWLPQGTARGAVVLVHGSGGWSDGREGHYGRALSAAGYAALAIDSFGPRGIANTTEDQGQITSTQMARDAYAARDFLSSRNFAAEKTAVFGFSKGGASALFSVDKVFMPRETPRFAAAIAFYPACNARARHPQPTSPIFMALGEEDDYSGVRPCQEVAQASIEAGGKVEVKVYPKAAHGFDGDLAHTRMTYLRHVENFMNCPVFLEDDGSLSHMSKRYAPGDPALLRDMRASCVKKGATVWTNPSQKKRATQDAIDFLDRVLR